jgi:GntR family transcriptional regulator
VQADAETALPLDIEAGGPVILVERTAYTYDDKIVEYRKTYGRSDKFLYRIQLP